MFTPIDFQTEDAVWVSRNLYCKTPEALETVLATLRSIGYTVEDQRVDGYAIQEGRTTPEQMEQNGWSLWYARLEDIARGKCKSCGSYISRQGIRMHGHQCEVCGEVTYYEMEQGSTIRFSFKGEDRHWLSPDLHMTVQRWDTDEGYLYLRWEFQEARRFGIMDRSESLEYLDKHIDKWTSVEEDGQQLMKVRHPLRHWGDPVDDEDAIEVRDIWGHRFNYHEVKVWEGQEYTEYDWNFPIPESISIYESWHWAPLPASPTLHEDLF